MRIPALSLAAALTTALPCSVAAQPIAMPTAEYQAVVNGFRAALLAGDTKAVAEHLAPGATVLIDGKRSLAQSSSESLPQHAPQHACMFTGSPMHVFSVSYLGDIRVQSATYWLYKVVENQTTGVTCAESAVMSKIDGKWRIHIIHWSSGPLD